MKKTLLLLCLGIILSINLYGQKILINGEETARPLKWSDFKGKVNDSDPTHAAYIYYVIRYKWKDIQARGDSAFFVDLQFSLELDSTKSWVRKEKQSYLVLHHEQGHFDIAQLCMRDMIATAARTHFKPMSAGSILERLFGEKMEEYNTLQMEYDRQTSNGRKKIQQGQWDARIAEGLAKK